MANRSLKALAAVERALRRNNKANPGDLRTAAEKADSSIKKLDPRSFNARYALPTKRKLGLTKITKKRAKRGGAASRKRGRSRKLSGRAMARHLVQQRDQQVRDVLVANKDADAAYQLGAGIDGFLDQIEKALGS